MTFKVPCTLERWFEMPRKWTFEMPKVRRWIESRLEGRVLNLFGGVTPLTPPAGGSVLTNDINPNYGELHYDAYDLAAWAELVGAFDTVVFDPPYSAHQAVVSYGGVRMQRVSAARRVVDAVLRPKGRVLSCGFNSTGMGMRRGFQKDAIALVNCGGSHNDFILVSEVR